LASIHQWLQSYPQRHEKAIFNPKMMVKYPWEETWRVPPQGTLPSLKEPKRASRQVVSLRLELFIIIQQKPRNASATECSSQGSLVKEKKEATG